MKLTVNNDFRKFKAGDEYIFTSFDNERKNDTDTRILYIVGDNGTGKIHFNESNEKSLLF